LKINLLEVFFKKKKINSLLHVFFAVAAVETLVGVVTCGERGGAGGSYELDAARRIQSKSFSHILDLPGGFIWKA
jgi:hypothetical protein